MSTKPKGLYVNQELWLQVKIKSPQLGLTMSAFTEQAIQKQLNSSQEINLQEILGVEVYDRFQKHLKNNNTSIEQFLQKSVAEYNKLYDRPQVLGAGLEECCDSED
jgi:hypothetical protein